MSLNNIMQITVEDRRLIEDRRLGIPLSAYFVKKGLIRYYAIYGFSFIVSFIVLLVFIIIDSVPQQQVLDFSTAYAHAINAIEKLSLTQEHMATKQLSYIVAIFVLLFGLFLLLFYRPSLKRRRIIVCTNGLLQVRKKIVGDRVEAIHWHEIQSIKLPFAGQGHVRLMRKSGKPIVIVDYYENFDELLAQIKQYSHLA